MYVSVDVFIYGLIVTGKKIPITPMNLSKLEISCWTPHKQVIWWIANSSELDL